MTSKTLTLQPGQHTFRVAWTYVDGIVLDVYGGPHDGSRFHVTHWPPDEPMPVAGRMVTITLTEPKSFEAMT